MHLQFFNVALTPKTSSINVLTSKIVMNFMFAVASDSAVDSNSNHGDSRLDKTTFVILLSEISV